MEQYIGPCCISDEYLQGVIETSAERRRCDYCKRTFHDLSCCGLRHVAEAIKQAISEHYTPQDEVPRADGDFLFDGESTADIARDLSMDFIAEGADDASIIADLQYLLGHDDLWVERKSWPGNGEEETLWLWESFKKLVQHKNRYFFGVEGGSSDGFRYSIHSSPMELLGSVCGRLLLDETLTALDPETSIYRVRKHRAGIDRNKPSEFCAPTPEKCVQANRMSPPGIQMFYGALDRETARLEVGTTSPYYLAEFKTTERVLLIDLTKQFSRMSMFAPESAGWNEYAGFMNGFVSDLARPIAHDDRIHIEYIPTQVVAEYLRFHSPDSNARGFLFPSHRGSGGHNVAFFGNPVVDQEPEEDSRRDDASQGVPFLKYVRVRRVWT